MIYQTTVGCPVPSAANGRARFLLGHRFSATGTELGIDTDKRVAMGAVSLHLSARFPGPCLPPDCGFSNGRDEIEEEHPCLRQDQEQVAAAQTSNRNIVINRSNEEYYVEYPGDRRDEEARTNRWYGQKHLHRREDQEYSEETNSLAGES